MTVMILTAGHRLSFCAAIGLMMMEMMMTMVMVMMIVC